MDEDQGSQGRIRFVTLDGAVVWVLEDAEGTPMCIGERASNLDGAELALRVARACGRADTSYRRVLVDRQGIVLARSPSITGFLQLELATAWTRREFVLAPLVVE